MLKLWHRCKREGIISCTNKLEYFASCITIKPRFTFESISTIDFLDKSYTKIALNKWKLRKSINLNKTEFMFLSDPRESVCRDFDMKLRIGLTWSDQWKLHPSVTWTLSTNQMQDNNKWKIVVRRARNILQTIYREFETLLIIGHAWRILPKLKMQW